MNPFQYKNLGYGLGFRPKHFSEILKDPRGVQWFEALTENYLGIEGHGQGPLFPMLLKIRETFPVVMHCVSTNLGSTSGVDQSFLTQLKEMIQVIEPAWVSDHLCWTGIHDYNSHELLPLPYTPEAIEIVSNNIHQVQEFLGRRFMIENTSSYISYENSEMTEWEFITEIIKKTDCGLLLDVNNIYVSSQNHDYDPKLFIDSIPHQNVGQIHLAGHIERSNGLLVDTHNQPMCDEVIELLAYTYHKCPDVSVMVEWDGDIPDYAALCGELDKARQTKEQLLL